MKDKMASDLNLIADAIDADTIHLSDRAKEALSRVSAAIARQVSRESGPSPDGKPRLPYVRLPRDA